MKGPTQTEIEEALTCQCGCGLTVHSCNHLQCPSAIPLKEEIGEQLALGKTHAETLQHFAGSYGEKILSAPTTSGFNIVAWVTPFLALFVAGAVVVAFVVRWRGRALAGPAVPPPVGGAADTARRARLQDELDRFEG
jgi:cytochrome c-type biogenesis protein CcmH